ncbi:MAG TPA: hypothetical protein PKE45_00340, partial [Caldilineaceae bacterium]|nr:hypothetical protein [Caldilineaceae bacterium]
MSQHRPRQAQTRSGPRQHRPPTGAIFAGLLALLLAATLPMGLALAQNINDNTDTLFVAAGETLYFGDSATNNAASGAVQNNGDIHVATSFTFQAGVIQQDANGLFIFYDNATASGASPTSHVDGRVRKIGNDAFTFPTGNGGRLGPLSISAPANATDQVDARYFAANPNTAVGAALASDLAAISSVEYWDVDGAPSVNLTLHWGAASNVSTLTSGNLASLRVAGWTGSQWVNLGANSVSGTTSAGSVTVNGVVPNGSQFYTLAAALDSDDDSVPNDEDPAPTDPCVPNANALACPTGDTDGDGVPNDEDPAPTDPSVPHTNAP